MKRRLLIGCVAAIALFGCAAGEDSATPAFPSSEECLIGLPKAEPTIDAGGLAARCGVDEGRAGAALALAAASTPTTTAAPAPASEPAEATTAPSTLVEPAPGAEIVVPNVIGMDHQLAQDTMQSVGLYLLDEMDGSGQGRSLLWDRNWTVVEQQPVAGTVVTSDTRVTLVSVKDDEA